MTSRSTIQLTNDENENAEGMFGDDEEDNFLTPQTPQRPLAKRRKKNSEETKQTLISKCIDVLDKPKQGVPVTPQADPYALYVSLQLKQLDNRRRLMAEKRINGILFEIRYEELSSHDGSLMQPMQAANFVPGPYTNMLREPWTDQQ